MEPRLWSSRSLTCNSEGFLKLSLVNEALVFINLLDLEITAIEAWKRQLQRPISSEVVPESQDDPFDNNDRLHTSEYLAEGRQARDIFVK